MSEAFEAEIIGVAAAILVTVTIWVLYSNYVLSLFEATLGVASSLIVAAFFITGLIKANYNDDFLEENSV